MCPTIGIYESYCIYGFLFCFCFVSKRKKGEVAVTLPQLQSKSTEQKTQETENRGGGEVVKSTSKSNVSKNHSYCKITDHFCSF